MENERYKILLVDDELDILDFVGYNLQQEGFEVYTATNGLLALEVARKHKPHLVILDIMMPGMDGIETCERLRSIEQLGNTLIVFLTARGEDYSQIAGFQSGADDYIIKPVKPKVLISRIHALLKRLPVSHSEKGTVNNVLQRADLKIDSEKYMIYRGKTEFALPKKEFELLLLLASRPGRVYSRNEILQAIWDDNVIVGDRTIDVHIRKLREKLGDEYIKTIKGVGYKFAE